MRTLTPAALAAAIAQYGSEPANVIEVQWRKDGPRTTYADKDIASPPVPGRIINLSSLDQIVNISNGSDTAEIAITLSDIDGHLKGIIDNNDVHKRDVWVYQWYEGLDLDDKFLLFHGVVNSPVRWNEGDRTLSFTVITKVEDAEIGFSVEEGQFANIPDDLIGKPWPLKFGTTYNVPALRFNQTVRGNLLTGVGIADFWLPYKINSQLICPNVFIGFTSRYEGLSLVITPAYQPDPACLVRACDLIRRAEIQYAEQVAFEFNQIRVIDGDKFPQNTEITLDIDGGLFTGSFGVPDAKTFTITSRQHPEYDELGPPTESKLLSLLEEEDDAIKTGCGVPDITTDGGAIGGGTAVTGEGGGGGFAGGQPAAGTKFDLNALGDPSIQNLYESEVSFNLFNGIPTPGFFWAEAGTTVELAGNQETVYVSNIVPETVHRVMAYRQLDNQRRLVTVPQDFYTVRTSNFNTYQVTEIVFETPLSRIDSAWEDDIYVTSTSSVGPNTVDIMEWLIDKYTNLLTDPGSFNNVRARLENYPMDFPYLERKNILAALRELAFQNRCAIFLRDDRFYLKYLAETPPANDIITASDIDANTLELFHTDTEEVVTKLVAEWKKDYALEDPNTTIIRHNVQQYGLIEKKYDFYAFNELDYITKSLTFWAIRLGNTWRKLSFQTPPHKIRLETFDSINFNVASAFPSTIPGLIEQADYDSATRTITFMVHTTCKSGTTVPYPYFHPADLAINTIWPQQQEWEEGIVGSGTEAPGFSTFAPPGHPLSVLQLPQGFSFGPCGAEATQVTYDTIQQQAKADVPPGDPRFNEGFNRQAKRTCGDDKGDPSPTDRDDSKKDKDVSDDSAVPQSDVYKTRREKLAELGGQDPVKEAKKAADDALGTALTAATRASAANEAAMGPGSGSEEENPDPSNLPSKDSLEEKGANEQDGQACLFTATLFIGRAESLGGPNGSEGPGFIGNAPLIRRDEFTFRTCIEAQRVVCAALKVYSQRQEAQNISKGDELPVNAVSICPNYFPPCDNDAPESGEENPFGLPEPIGFDSFEPGPGGAPIPDPPEPDYMDDILEYLSNDVCVAG